MDGPRAKLSCRSILAQFLLGSVTLLGVLFPHFIKRNFIDYTISGLM